MDRFPSIYTVHPSQADVDGDPLTWLRFQRTGGAAYSHYWHGGRDQHDMEKVWTYADGNGRMGDDMAMAAVAAGRAPELPDPNQLVADADALLAYTDSQFGPEGIRILRHLRQQFSQGMPTSADDLVRPIRLLQYSRVSGSTAGASRELQQNARKIREDFDRICEGLSAYAAADVYQEYHDARPDAPIDRRIDSAVWHLTDFLSADKPRVYRDLPSQTRIGPVVYGRLADRLEVTIEEALQKPDADASTRAKVRAVTDFMNSLQADSTVASGAFSDRLRMSAEADAKMPPMERLQRFDAQARQLESVMANSDPAYARTFARLSGAQLTARAPDVQQQLIDQHGRNVFSRQVGRLFGRDPKDKLPAVDPGTRSRLVYWNRDAAWQHVRGVQKLPKTEDALNAVRKADHSRNYAPANRAREE